MVWVGGGILVEILGGGWGHKFLRVGKSIEVSASFYREVSSDNLSWDEASKNLDSPPT